ncbi:polysaccharide deacetylase family protein [uncultured Bacteroides sp.]|uniref:polysaccharide deacetylase family protein n=1 Tax=uncultured Bacteroides sp. TaxID=162156 RepID=UPI002AAC0EC5|nr:polysaccharide deacetylase family protein [uncultured Bacteroides sp.]
MIALSFDIEEFDLPAEHGKQISFDEQIRISTDGLLKILDLLKKWQIKATFFSTIAFAQSSSGIIERIVSEGHELASHGCSHSEFSVEDLKVSKDILEKMSGTSIYGFRMPRMMPIDEKELFLAGYIYNSSLNPTLIPGRYNNLNRPRNIHKEEGVWQVPASVAYPFRIPLFWISLHQFPLFAYKLLCNSALNKDGYLNIYFHPWEYYNHLEREELGVPGFICKNSGDKLVQRLDSIIDYYLNKDVSFITISELLQKKVDLT